MAIPPELFIKLLQQQVIPTFECDCTVPEWQVAFDMCIHHGCWPMPIRTWMSELASYIGKASVLEVYAGGGWLARYLAWRGVDIIATDNRSWGDVIFNSNVLQYGAVAAVQTFNTDILLMSYPPYLDATVERVLENTTAKKLIYIGEGKDGNCATRKFFDMFTPHTIWQMPNWPGQHSVILFANLKE